MGVDITAFRQLAKITCNLDDKGEPVDPVLQDRLDDGELERIYVNPDFPTRADNLEHKAIYSYAKSERFISLSYGGYNRLRDKLAKLAGYPEEEHSGMYGINEKHHCWACWRGVVGPFCELINFSDCEGVIGPSTSARLAKDFEDFQEKADAETDENFKRFYSQMRKAFEMASDNGMVRYS